MSDHGPHQYKISGITVDFPCKAYPSQIAMMNKVSRNSMCQKKGHIVPRPEKNQKIIFFVGIFY